MTDARPTLRTGRSRTGARTVPSAAPPSAGPAHPCSTGWTWTSPPARSSPSSAPPAAASRPCCAPWPGCCLRSRARSPRTGGPLTGPGADRALVFQEDALLPWRTLRANVELPLAIKGCAARRAPRSRPRPGWSGSDSPSSARQLPHRVSGGQRQRAQLARALAGRPRAVLMDEPFGALDAQTRAGMQDLLVEVLHGTGATVVFVTHDVDEALFLGDRVALLGAAGLAAVRDIPRPRDRAAHDDPARVALRRDVLTSLGT